MKKIFIGLLALCALPLVFSACQEERTSYEGPDYVMFSDTLSVLGVQNNEEYFDVAVAAMQPCDTTVSSEWRYWTAGATL